MESLTNRSIQVTMMLKSTTMRKMVSLIPGHCSTVFSSPLHSTLWWHWPIGTSKYFYCCSTITTYHQQKAQWKKNAWLEIIFFSRPNSTLQELNQNAASMWVKIISSWLCAGLYGWSLLAPIVLKDRVFE